MDFSSRRVPCLSRDVDPDRSLSLHLQLHAGTLLGPSGFGRGTRRMLEGRGTMLGTPDTVGSSVVMSDSRLGICLGRTGSFFSPDRLLSLGETYRRKYWKVCLSCVLLSFLSAV